MCLLGHHYLSISMLLFFLKIVKNIIDILNLILKPQSDYINSSKILKPWSSSISTIDCEMPKPQIRSKKILGFFNNEVDLYFEECFLFTLYNIIVVSLCRRKQEARKAIIVRTQDIKTKEK